MCWAFVADTAGELIVHPKGCDFWFPETYSSPGK